jgi:hypothetical protein
MMDFSEASELMKQGKKVRMLEWELPEYHYIGLDDYEGGKAFKVFKMYAVNEFTATSVYNLPYEYLKARNWIEAPY